MPEIFKEPFVRLLIIVALLLALLTPLALHERSAANAAQIERPTPPGPAFLFSINS